MLTLQKILLKNKSNKIHDKNYKVNHLVQGFFACIGNPVKENDRFLSSDPVFRHLMKLKKLVIS